MYCPTPQQYLSKQKLDVKGKFDAESEIPLWGESEIII